jgi:putative hemolysin
MGISTLLLFPIIIFAQETAFVPLTSLPGLSEIGNTSPSLPTFLNSVYKICIGLAATIAILQIMRAGFLFMTNKGSVSHNEQAKGLITGSIFGLILVLSPAIVFGIINPQILNISLDFSALQPSPLDTYTTNYTGVEGSTYTSTSANARALCEAEGGKVSTDSSNPGVISCTLPKGQCHDFTKNTSVEGTSLPPGGGVQTTCCQKQGCTVNASGTGASARTSCTCKTPPPSPNDIANFTPGVLLLQYRWSGQFVDGKQPPDPTKAGYKKSAIFDSPLLCQVDYNSKITEAGLKPSPLAKEGCNCSEKTSSFSVCEQ